MIEERIMPFTFCPSDIPNVTLIKPQIFDDSRGFFMESFKYSDFSKHISNFPEYFKQDNYSYSYKGAIRGLHFQKFPSEQAKIVKVIKGEIFDVAVDIRKNSPTYGKYVAYNLSEENNNMLYIPVGFAHGFGVLSDSAHVIYKASNEYAPECDAGIIYDDPDINIVWPIRHHIVSKKDKSLPSLKEFGGI